VGKRDWRFPNRSRKGGTQSSLGPTISNGLLNLIGPHAPLADLVPLVKQVCHLSSEAQGGWRSWGELLAASQATVVEPEDGDLGKSRPEGWGDIP
jgi:hypothetical protein